MYVDHWHWNPFTMFQPLPVPHWPFSYVYETWWRRIPRVVPQVTEVLVSQVLVGDSHAGSHPSCLLSRTVLLYYAFLIPSPSSW